MRVRMLFFRLFFVAIFFILSESCNASQSQEFTTDTYVGNYEPSGGFGLHLRNGDREFVIHYGASHYSPVSLYFVLNSEHQVKINSVKLNGENACVSGFSRYELMLVERNSYGIKFNECKAIWKKLIRDAKGGDLTFSLLGVQKETGIKETYEFRVSAENLSLLVDLIEKVYVGK
ncbi:hypothetical protein bcCo53_001202 (plasmid) [Borrelia coriaceae]|nr:hypothetical protein [Borrelia coriaceae]UPA17033.1 hypothetical protein bcCo53_001202 [Borrelia coriaceae]